MTTDPVETVRNFCLAFGRMDVEEIMAYFADDAVYHNMPGPPAKGSEAIRRTISGFLKGWEKTEWEIVNICASGDTVFAERIDRTDASGKHVDLACVGVFEMKGGKIKAWRDYFDLATYTRAMS